MKRLSFGMLAALAALGLAAAGGDTEDGKTYDVTVSWNIAGAETCVFNLDADTQLEFDVVQIDLYDAQGDEAPIQAPIQVDCADFGYTITRLERGKYFAEIGAWAEDEDGDYLPYFQASGEIRAPAETEEGYEFGLLLGTGDIDIVWDFDGPGWCDSNGVTDLDISLVDELVPCDQESYLLEDVSPGNYTLTIDGLDADGNDVVAGEYNDGQPFSIKPGELIEAIVVLE